MLNNNKQIDANSLKNMFLLAAKNLEANTEFVNSLNVFPVPDGDTGTNMSLTIQSGAKYVSKIENAKYVHEVTKAFSQGLLMGARGNSGVIFSQIFRGFNNACVNSEVLTTTQFAHALQEGAVISYKSVMKPVEGTILTVIRETAEAAVKLAEQFEMFDIFLEKLTEASLASLKNTQNILPILKEVGVVDSGGQGLEIVLESFAQYVSGTEDFNLGSNIETTNKIQFDTSFVDSHEGEFGFCTEFILRVNNVNSEEETKAYFEEKITALGGQSLVVVCMDDLVKVHVHVENPLETFQFAASQGEFITLKSENMQEQFENTQENKTSKKEIDQLVIGVAAGEGIVEFFYGVGVVEMISGGQTMNPSTEDFIEIINKYDTKKVIILPNNSNIILAAEQVKSMLTNYQIAVISSKTIPEGISAALAFNPGVTFEENIVSMNNALTLVKSGQITFAVRDTVIEGIKVTKDDYLAINEKSIIASIKNREDALVELLDSMINDSIELVTIFSGEDVQLDTLELLKVTLVEKFPDVEFEIYNGKQPVYSYVVSAE